MAKPAATPREAEDHALAALANGEGGRALTLLMELYGDEIYRHCVAMVGADLATDVHQLTFVQAFRDLAAFRGSSSLRTWLFAIARHRCLDALRAEKRRARRKEALRPEIPPTSQPMLVESLDGIRQTEALCRALRALEAKDRIAVLLRFYHHMSYDEMADVSGERAKTLQARVTRALPKLRKELESLGVKGVW